jgi:hypothetical protein
MYEKLGPLPGKSFNMFDEFSLLLVAIPLNVS